MPLDSLLARSQPCSGGSAPTRPPSCWAGCADARACSAATCRAPAQPLPVLADSMLGPAVLYGALARVLGRLAERGPLVVLIDDAHLAGRALPNC